MYKAKHFKKSKAKHTAKRLFKVLSLLVKLIYCIVKLINYITNHL